jgi:hypothetical protein
MKAPLIHLAWALVAIIAFVMGYSLGNGADLSRAETKPTPKSDSSAGVEARGGANRQSDSSQTAARPILTSEQARVRTFQLLAEPNRIDRMRQLCDLLPSVTAENWHDVLAAFDLQMQEEGRQSDDDWFLILERIGEVAGAAALVDAVVSDKPFDRQRVSWLLKGWLARDPKEAAKWFEAQRQETQQALMGDFVTGISRSDPKQALLIAGQQPQNIYHGAIPSIMANAVQIGGLRATDELLLAIRDRSDIPDPMKGDVFGNTALRRIDIARARGEPMSVLDWAGQYVGQEFMGPNATREIVSFAAKKDVRATMRWIDANAGKWTLRQEEAVFPVIAQAMRLQVPEEFTAWVNGQPDDRQRDLMLEGASRFLIQSRKMEEARRLSNGVVNPDVRARLEQLLRQSEAARQRQTQ